MADFGIHVHFLPAAPSAPGLAGGPHGPQSGGIVVVSGLGVECRFRLVGRWEYEDAFLRGRAAHRSVYDARVEAKGTPVNAFTPLIVICAVARAWQDRVDTQHVQTALPSLPPWGQRELSRRQYAGIAPDGILDAAERCEPVAGSVVESYRTIGYRFTDAVADIIDNCIPAGATKVRIERGIVADEPFLAIIDDGSGMTEDDLRLAMKPGSRSPREERLDPEDLGRFTLGLKTASWSQARVLVVASKTSGGSWATRSWDLDFIEEVNDWLQRDERVAFVAARLRDLLRDMLRS